MFQLLLLLLLEPPTFQLLLDPEDEPPLELPLPKIRTELFSFTVGEPPLPM